MEKRYGLYEPPREDFELNKMIFLDIDGVLVNREMLKKGHEQFIGDNHHDFDANCVKFLESIIENTKAYIIITSSWRKNNLEHMREIFKNRGFKYWHKIIGETCDGNHFRSKDFRELSFFRGNEIEAWIKKFIEKDVDGNYLKNVRYHYVIIDDDSDMLYWQRHNFINTNTEHGLSEKNAIDAVNILCGGKHYED